MLENFVGIMNVYWEGLITLLPKLAVAIIVFLIFLVIGSRVAALVRRAASIRMDDPLIVRFLGRMAKWSFIMAGLIFGMLVLGLGGIAGGILAGAGVSALILGFAFKDIGENFLAGIILAFSRPYKIGDKIETGKVFGVVRGLDLRNTHIKTFDGKDVYVPNAMLLKNPMINYTRDGFLRYEFVVGIDYEYDIQRVSDLILAATRDVKGVLDGVYAPEVQVSELSTSTVNLIVYFWTDTFDDSIPDPDIKTDVMNQTRKALIENNITMPADILELKVYNEELPIPVRIIESRTRGD